MRSVVSLSVANQEIVSVFERKVNKKSSFIEQVTLKLGLMVRQSMKGNVKALVALSKLKERILDEIDAIFDESDKYEGMIEKRSGNRNKTTVNFINRFNVEMNCSNEIGFSLIELFYEFDALISKLKHFRLLGGFEDNEAFYAVKSKIQKKLNTLLTSIVISPSNKLSAITVDEFIQNPNFDVLPIEDLNILINSLNASYAPGYSPRVREQHVINLKRIEQEQPNQLKTA